MADQKVSGLFDFSNISTGVKVGRNTPVFNGFKLRTRWKLLIDGENVTPILYCGTTTQDAASPVLYAMKRTKDHPEGDPAAPDFYKVYAAIPNTPSLGRKVHNKDWTPGMRTYVETITRGFAEPKVREAVLTAIREQLPEALLKNARAEAKAIARAQQLLAAMKGA